MSKNVHDELKLMEHIKSLAPDSFASSIKINDGKVIIKRPMAYQYVDGKLLFHSFETEEKHFSLFDPDCFHDMKRFLNQK